MDRLSKSGPAIIEAFNGQVQTEAQITGATIVDFNDLGTTGSYKVESGNNLTDDLSSHIQVIHDNGWVEEFELVLTPHHIRDYGNKAKRSTLSTNDTWLALNPDIFYVEEDNQGNEIWPVTFPAISLANPDVEIEVTLDRDGTLSWPVKAKQMSSVSSTNPELLYVDRVAMIEPCEDGSLPDPIHPCNDEDPPARRRRRGLRRQ